MENVKEVVQNTELRKKLDAYMKSIEVTGDSTVKKAVPVKKIRTNGLFQLNGERPMDELSGVCIDGVHYYDFKNVHYINNTGIAGLIDLLKCLLEQDIKIQFVNVNEKIKMKIKSMGLENILKCS